MTSTEAYDKLQGLRDKALFSDVRTRAEVSFLGMPTVADANIPYMTPGAFDEWDEKNQKFKLFPNSEFVLRVNELVEGRGLTKARPIFLLCRSGSRSAKAAKILDAAGYTTVYTVTDGLEGDKAKSGPTRVGAWSTVGRTTASLGAIDVKKMIFALLRPLSARGCRPTQESFSGTLYMLEQQAMYWEL